MLLIFVVLNSYRRETGGSSRFAVNMAAQFKDHDKVAYSQKKSSYVVARFLICCLACWSTGWSVCFRWLVSLCILIGRCVCSGKLVYCDWVIPILCLTHFNIFCLFSYFY